MELKGSNNWSDVDSSEETDSSRPSPEAPRLPLPTPETAPERRAPLFNLGVIYSRQEVAPVLQQDVFQERDRSAPEVAQGITLGSAPEQAGAAAAASAVGTPHQAEQARLQQAGVEAANSDDDDDEATDEKQEKPAAKPVQIPPVVGVETPTFQPPQSEQFPQPVVPSQETEYPAFAQATEVPAPAPEPDNQPQAWQQQTRFQGRASVPPQPVEYMAPPVEDGGGNVPPIPPNEQNVPFYPPERTSGEPNPLLAQPTYNRYYSLQSPNQNNQYVTRRTFENAQADMRRTRAAQLIMVAALTWYLARRPIKPLRAEVSSLQDANRAQAEQVSRLALQQQEAQAHIAEQNRQIEQFTRPQSSPFYPEQAAAFRPQPAVVPHAAEQQPKIIGENGEEIVLEPGQRLVREGVYSEVVDAQNQVVQNVMPRGKEYQLDRSRERMPSPFGSQDARFAQGGMAGAGSSNQPMASPGSVLPNLSFDHTLPMNSAGQTPNQEAQHLLNVPKPNPFVLAVTSPWLWLGVGVLLIAFFAAATI